MTAFRWILLISLTILLQAQPAAADKYYIPELPKDPENITFHLLTVDSGPIVADRFGHLGIRVVDREQGTDAVFHWGKYSFKSPMFLWSFFRGELTYSMGIWPYRTFVKEYNFQKRNLYQDELNLTNNQKVDLLNKLRWNSFPENRDFAYQYWFRNCATVPRDYIDGVLDGNLRLAYYTKPANTRFRNYVRQYLGVIPGVEFGLDMIMNDRIDRPITQWEEMFLPMNLRDRLAEMPAISDSGNPIPGSKLLVNSQQLLKYPLLTRSTNDYQWFALVVLGPLFLAALMVAIGRRQGAMRVFGFVLLTFGLVSGTFGSVLLLNWALSGHPDTWANSNLFAVWPVDFIFAVAGYRILRSGKAIKDRWPFVGGLKCLCIAHVLGLALMAALFGLGVLEQDVKRTILSFGGYQLILSVVLVTVGLERYVGAEGRRQPVQGGSGRLVKIPTD